MYWLFVHIFLFHPVFLFVYSQRCYVPTLSCCLSLLYSILINVGLHRSMNRVQIRNMPIWLKCWGIHLSMQPSPAHFQNSRLKDADPQSAMLLWGKYLKSLSCLLSTGNHYYLPKNSCRRCGLIESIYFNFQIAGKCL